MPSATVKRGYDSRKVAIDILAVNINFDLRILLTVLLLVSILI